MDIKGEINSNTVIVGNLNTTLTSMDRLFRQNINKQVVASTDILDQMDLIVIIFRAFHLKAAEYIFFSCAHGTFPRIDHMLGHKTSFSKFEKIEIIPHISSDHNGMKLEINYKKKTEK